MEPLPPPTDITVPPSHPSEHVDSTFLSPQAQCDKALVEEKFAAFVKEQPNNNQEHHSEKEAQPVNPENHDQISYPEGGLSAWLVVIGSCFGTAVTLGMM